jgi:hypothetical protein
MRLFCVSLALLATGAATPGAGAPSGLDELLAQAEAHGHVRVLVELTPGPQGLAAAQDALLRSLAGTSARVTRRYAQLPFLALEVSPAALRVLVSAPAVRRIQADHALSPQEKQRP